MNGNLLMDYPDNGIVFDRMNCLESFKYHDLIRELVLLAAGYEPMFEDAGICGNMPHMSSQNLIHCLIPYIYGTAFPVEGNWGLWETPGKWKGERRKKRMQIAERLADFLIEHRDPGPIEFGNLKPNRITSWMI